MPRSLASTLDFGDSYRPPETYYAKGQYYALSGRSPFKRHIYPMPDGAWLGLHATVDIGGRCKFGPDIEWTPGIDYSFQPEKLEQFLDFIRSYYPGLEVERLHPDYTGVRPKLYREGEPVPDFAIHGPASMAKPASSRLFGIESPGLTAALAIGELVVEHYRRADVSRSCGASNAGILGVVRMPDGVAQALVELCRVEHDLLRMHGRHGASARR